MKITTNWIYGLVIISILVIPAYLLSKKPEGPLPGQEIADLGRDHVTDIADVTYNSDPPTSGPHFPMWAKKGIYDRLISDGYLIHSLEHGYIIISYDCTKPTISYPWKVNNVSAHDEPTMESTDSGQLLKHMKLVPTGEMAAFTPETAPDVEVELPDEFKSESCKSLVNKLSEFVPQFERILIVPRINMETPITLTAWNRIEKLESVDNDKILEFIKAFHNKGPEKTVEN